VYYYYSAITNNLLLLASLLAIPHLRLSTPSPSLPTQYALMQERYAHDGWRLLCACVLMSRCNSGEVKEKCITGFFKLCQTPSDFGDVNPEKLRKTVHSLGFQVDRVRAGA